MKHFSNCKLLTFIGIATIFFCIVILVLHFYLEVYITSSSVIYNYLSSRAIYGRDTDELLSNDVQVPIILWWTPFTGEKAALRKCGNVECFFTEDRKFRYHSMVKVIMFYGSQFDVLELPLPRNGSHILWALFHEESPKNTPVLSHENALKYFNFTATFSRQSNFPLTFQYLPNLEAIMGHKFFIPLKKKNKYLEEIAPVLYIHSDCNTPLERDAYVSELMKYIPIDSYGTCLNNHQLPKALADPVENFDSEEFYHFVAKYKFTLAFENSLCHDYITEKLWRPLIVGSIPIYLGSPTVIDWLPNLQSAIVVSDYESPKMLAKFLHELNKNDSLYTLYLEHKLNNIDKRINNFNLKAAINARLWGIRDDFEKGNMVEHFECFICNESHKKHPEPGIFIANISHYNCPIPVSPLTWKTNSSNWWLDQWKMGQCEAESLNYFIGANRINYTKREFHDKVKEILLLHEC